MAMLRTKIPGSSLVLLALVALSGCVNDSVDTPQGAMPAADGRLIRFTAGSSESGDTSACRRDVSSVAFNSCP